MGKCKLLGGGINIGKYVWERYVGHIEAEDFSFSFKLVTGQTALTYQLYIDEGHSYDEIFNNGGGGYNWTFSRVYGTNGYYYDFTVSTNGAGTLTVFYTSNISSGQQKINYTWNPTSGRLVLPTEYVQYFDTTTATSNTKTLTSPEVQGTLDAFVVAGTLIYPDGDFRGEYFYELLASVDSANAYSLTDTAVATLKDIAIEEVQQEVITNVD